MTIYEQMLMDTIIKELPKIRKVLENINYNLEKLNNMEVRDGDTCDET